MDEWTSIHQQKAFDDNGLWASHGQLNEELLQQMLADEYFLKPAPKSTGREYFNYQWYENFIELFKTTSANDIQTTLCHLVAASINLAIDKAPHQIDEIILMGGGIHNAFLLKLIKQHTQLKTITANDLGYDSDWIEAMLFAFLAAKRIKQEKLELHSFTGSTRPILVGDIIIP
jgi:anhydro-N-acetylmuramic acid kinase